MAEKGSVFENSNYAEMSENASKSGKRIKNASGEVFHIFHI